MLPQEVIRRKRDGAALTISELNFIARGLADGSISEGQGAAFAMSVFFQGMQTDEIANWTLAMRDSGHTLDWSQSGLDGPVLDKHSSGGVGDKVSLMLAPMLAACGAYVPMISGRGLGHTGGTLDKLEAIAGFATNIAPDHLRKIVKQSGCAIISASKEIAPADQRLYAIRDVTATVDSMPLITASILSKKLAAGLDGLVLDIKTGTGAFASTIDSARELADNLVSVGNAADLPTRALITDMNQVLGRSAGNALEVAETIDYLTTTGSDERLDTVVVELGAELLVLGGLAASHSDAQARLRQSLASGEAAERFMQMSSLQGATAKSIESIKSGLPQAEIVAPVGAPSNGYIESMDVRKIGLAIIGLGGGRTGPADRIDWSVGFSRIAGMGEAVTRGQPVAMVHARSQSDADQASEQFLQSLTIGTDHRAASVIHARL